MAAERGVLDPDLVQSVERTGASCLLGLKLLLAISRHVSLTCGRLREDRLGREMRQEKVRYTSFNQPATADRRPRPLCGQIWDSL